MKKQIRKVNRRRKIKKENELVRGEESGVEGRGGEGGRVEGLETRQTESARQREERRERKS
jgi:hypothetical protein